MTDKGQQYGSPANGNEPQLPALPTHCEHGTHLVDDVCLKCATALAGSDHFLCNNCFVSGNLAWLDGHQRQCIALGTDREEETGDELPF